jgi:hypothetical protein
MTAGAARIAFPGVLALALLACAGSEPIDTVDPSLPVETSAQPSTPPGTSMPATQPPATASLPPDLGAPAPTPTSVKPNPTADGPTPGPNGWIGPQLISSKAYHNLSLVIDAGGVAHAAAVLNDGIFYVTNASGSWTRERLTRPDGHDDDPSIALDDDGSLWVAFTHWPPEDPDYCPPDMADCFGPGPEGIYLVTNSSGSWSAPELLAAGGSNSPSLKVSNGTVHAAFLGSWVIGELSGPGRVHYLTNSGGEWTSEHLGRAYGGPVLELDREGRSRVAFWDVAEDEEGYLGAARVWYATARTASGDFSLEQLPQSAGANTHWLGNLELALDGQDRPHVVGEVWSDTADAIHYWHAGPAGWSEEVEVVSNVEMVALEADAAGAVHLLVSVPDCCLDYVSKRDGSFVGRTLHEAGGSGDAALDAQGRLHVLFIAGYGSQRELWYAIGVQ